MSDQSIVLGREVERLITAPYAPSLQDFYYITQSCSLGVIRSWASRKSCQIGALADVVVDGLSRSSFAVRLLGAFARVESFRNVLLERHPHLLDLFLQKAIEDGEFQYITVSSAMLSSPVPDNFIVPARLAPFITKLVSLIGEAPCAESIGPLYQLTASLQTCPRALCEIPSEIMSSLQVELTKMLRNFEDHMGNLLCLATFARIASSQKTEAVSKHFQSIPSWLQSIQHFFGPKRGFKTLDLVFLRVILACSASCNNLTTDQAVESIKLAIEICDTVETKQKEDWIKANSPKISKLCEKVAREDIDDRVQVLGVTYLVSLIPTATMSPEIPRLTLQWMLTQKSGRALDVLPADTIPRLVEANAIRLGSPAICGILDYVVSSLNTEVGDDPNYIGNLQLARLLLSGLHKVVPKLADTAVLEPIVACSEGIEQLTQSFPKQPAHPLCQGASSCYCSAADQQNKLICELFDLHTQSLILQCKNEKTFDTPGAMAFGTIMSRASKMIPENKCLFSTRTPLQLQTDRPTPRFREASPALRQDWRTSLAEMLMKNARTSHDDMMRKIEDVCYDLESRCQTIEAPLRVVEEERDKLSLEAQATKQQNNNLELQLQKATDTIARLQQDITRLETHAETVTVRVEELSASLDASHKELETQRHTSQEEADREREKSRSRELDLIASVTEQEERVDALEEEIRVQKEQNCKLHQELEIAERQQYDSTKDNESLREELDRLGKNNEEKQSLLEAKDEEIQQLLAGKENIEGQVVDLLQKLDQEVMKSAVLESTLDEAKGDFRMELDATTKQLEGKITARDTECAKQREEITSLQASLQAAEDSATKQLQTKDKRIQSLEKKVQRMRDERSTKAREFSEAQQHIGRLMAVMGFKPDSGHSNSSKTRSKSIIGHSPIPPARQQTHPADDPTESLPEDPETTSFDSVHLVGRSPKRPRDSTYAMAETPARPHEKRARNPTRRDSMRPRSERKVLGEADQNSQSSSQSSRMSSASQGGTFQESQYPGYTDENHLQGIDLDMDLELTKDFIFTSMSLSQTNDNVPPPGAQG